MSIQFILVASFNGLPEAIEKVGKCFISAYLPGALVQFSIQCTFLCWKFTKGLEASPHSILEQGAHVTEYSNWFHKHCCLDEFNEKKLLYTAGKNIFFPYA